MILEELDIMVVKLMIFMMAFLDINLFDGEFFKYNFEHAWLFLVRSRNRNLHFADYIMNYFAELLKMLNYSKLRR